MSPKSEHLDPDCPKTVTKDVIAASKLSTEFVVDEILLAKTFEFAAKVSAPNLDSLTGTKPLFHHSILLNCEAPPSIGTGTQIEVNVRQIADEKLVVQTNLLAYNARHALSNRKRRRLGSSAAEAAKLDLILVYTAYADEAELCAKIRRQKLPLAVSCGPCLTVKADRQLYLEFGLALVANSRISHYRHQSLGLKLMAYLLKDVSLVDPTAYTASPKTLMDIITRPYRNPGTIECFAVPNLLTTLLPYQCESVSWCLRREGVSVNKHGEIAALDASIRDYIVDPPLGWRKVPGIGWWASPYFLRLSSLSPERLNGGDRGEYAGKGLLAEEMGLGKTLEMIAVLLLHPRPVASLQRLVHIEHEASDGSCVKRALRPIKATLVIVPKTIAKQWVSELQLHAPSLRVLALEWRMPTVEELAAADVVVLNYHQLSNWLYYTATSKPRNFRHHRDEEIRTNCTLIDVQFWRVILDEVQMVHTGESAAAVTARRIPRIHAWAVSGTPVKTSLGDMRGITKFLDLHPFVEAPGWQRMISSPTDLSHTMQHIAIRHTKALVADQLQLTTQHRKLILLKFSTVERLRYDRLFTDFQHAARSSSHCNLSAWLLKLRQVCSHTISSGQNAAYNNESVALTLDQLLTQLVDEADSELWAEQSKKINAQLRVGQLYDKNYQLPNALSIWKSMLHEIEDHLAAVKDRLATAVAYQAAKKSRLDSLDAFAPKSSNVGDDSLLDHNTAEIPNITDLEDVNERDNELNGDEALGRRIADARKDFAIAGSRVKVLKGRVRSLQELLHKVCFFLGTGYFRSSQRLKLDLQSRKCEEELESAENKQILTHNMEQEVYFYDRAEKVRQNLLHEAELKVLELVKKQEPFALIKVNAYCPIPRSKIVDELASLIEQIANKARDILEQPLIDDNETKKPEELGAGVQSESDAYSKTLDLQAHAFIYLDFLQILFRDRAAAINGGTIQPFPPLPLERPEGLDDLVNLRQDIVEPLSLDRTSLISLMKTTHVPLQVRDQLQSEIRTCQNQYTTLRDLYNARVDYYRQLQNLSDQVKDRGFDELSDLSQLIALEQRKVNQMDITIARKLRDQTYVRNLEGSNHAASQLRSFSTEELLDPGTQTSDNDQLSSPCAICLEPIVNGSITSCGHTFCTECIHSWLEKRHTCPICKRQLTPANVHNFAVSLPAETKPILDQTSTPKSSDDESYATELYVPISHRLYNHIHHIPLASMYGIKIDMVVRHVLYLRSQDPTAQIVIFSQWAAMLLHLRNVLRQNSIKSASTLPNEQIGIHDFQTNPEIACILLHSRAQVAGLTLINANHVFLCEPLLNTALELQAISRINRIGQTRETFVWQFCVENTVEQTILGMTTKSRLAHVDNEIEADSTTLAEAPLQFGATTKASDAELAGNNQILRRILFKETECSSQELTSKLDEPD